MRFEQRLKEEVERISLSAFGRKNSPAEEMVRAKTLGSIPGVFEEQHEATVDGIE